MIVLGTSLVALVVVIAFPYVRNHALSGWHVGHRGNVFGYNLMFGWTDHFGEGGFRAVMYPQFTNPNPWYQESYQRQNIRNPLTAHPNQDGVLYAGKRIGYPPGRDTAVFAPDGSVSFITLAPKYLKYGRERTGTGWGGIFISRKRFPLDEPYDSGLNLRALKGDGLLPAWTALQEDEHSATIPVDSRPETIAENAPPIPGRDPMSVSYSYALPGWLTPWLILVFMLAPLPFLRKSLIRRSRARRGLCPTCGYDLRGGHDRCSECGAEHRTA